MRIHIYQVLLTGIHGARAWSYVVPEHIEVVGGELGLALHVVATGLRGPALSGDSTWEPLSELGAPLPEVRA